MDNIKVSILIPSRRANRSFKRMLKSFSKNCGNKQHEVEILVKIDPDDNRQFYEQCLSGRGFKYKIFQTPRLNGYNSLHLFYNDLAKHAKGDLLWVASDDLMVVRANDWLEDLWATRNTYSDNIYVIHVDVIGKASPDNNVIPIMSREMYQRMGHISQCVSNDKYVNFIAKRIKRVVKVHSVCIHHSNNITRLGESNGSFNRADMKGYIKTNVFPLFYDIRSKILLEKEFREIEDNRIQWKIQRKKAKEAKREANRRKDESHNV